MELATTAADGTCDVSSRGAVLDASKDTLTMRSGGRIPRMTDYRKGLHDLGDGCHTWLLPDGGWGFNNSGLVVGSGAALLVDTHFDLAHTREMLDGIEQIIDGAPLTTLVNTHSDGDHVFGNELVAARGVEIVASAAAAELMTQAQVDGLLALTRQPGSTGDFARSIFGPFTFEGITATGPDRTFTGELVLDVGGREVRLEHVGPAHTPGDTLVHVPDAKLLYSGDILFIGGTPIVWAGPVQRWIAACERILDLDVTRIVPGHGPVTDKSGVHAVREYLTFVEREARTRFEDGLAVEDAIASIDLGPWAGRPEASRIAPNVINVYQQLDPDRPRIDRFDLFGWMAELEGFTST